MDGLHELRAMIFNHIRYYTLYTRFLAINNVRVDERQHSYAWGC